MTKSRYKYSFSLNGQDEVDFETARSGFKIIDIIRLGIKEALKTLPKPSKQAINKAKGLI